MIIISLVSSVCGILLASLKGRQLDREVEGGPLSKLFSIFLGLLTFDLIVALILLFLDHSEAKSLFTFHFYLSVLPWILLFFKRFYPDETKSNPNSFFQWWRYLIALWVVKILLCFFILI